MFILLNTINFTSAQTVRRALFLGNSYTSFNNLPQLVATIADNAGDSLIFDTYAPGGYTIDDHANDVISQAKIMRGSWDYLALQEQSQLPALQDYFSNGLYGLVANFKTYNPCGRMMFYMTWGRKNGDPRNCPILPNYCTYIGMDTQIRASYIDMAMMYKGELSPVGAAWRYVRQNHASIELYEPDGSHPSIAGSYLAACCFYTAIFKKDPTLISYNHTLAAGAADVLKQAAKLVVFDSLTKWNYASTSVTAAFSYTAGSSGNRVNCLNASANADSYLWDFGDGTTSTTQHPTHNYANSGVYTITLTSYNCDLGVTYQNTVQKTVSFCSFTPTITPEDMMLCPGNTDTLWTQPYDSYLWFDVTGNPIAGANKQYLVTTGSNEYYVVATLNNCWEPSAPVSVYTYGNLINFNVQADGNPVGQDSACIGDTLTLWLSYNKPPFPPDSLVDWSVNGQTIAGYHNDTLLITNPGLYEAILRDINCSGFNKTRQLQVSFINCPTNNPTVLNDVLSIYPNPVNGVSTIECSRPLQVVLFDVYGRKLFTQNMNTGKNAIDISLQPAGIYFLHVVNGKQDSIKLIKL